MKCLQIECSFLNMTYTLVMWLNKYQDVIYKDFGYYVTNLSNLKTGLQGLSIYLKIYFNQIL